MSGGGARARRFGAVDAIGKLAPGRRAFVRWIAAWALVAVAALAPVGASLASAAAVEVAKVGPVGMTVADIDRAVDFYTGVLSFKKLSDAEVWGDDYEHLSGVFGSRARIVRLGIGEEQIELTQYLAPRGKAFPYDTRGNDRWFQHVAIIVSDMERAYQWLRDHKVEHASTGPQTLPNWNPNAGGIKAFYFRDPDGHFLEILWFPAGKGLAKWHTPTKNLFLGIDHTAITVADTDKSLGFYRDQLGMRVAGGAENWGTEQEHLNNVFGAHLRITAVRAKDGPGIELLEYLAPRDGRSYPVEAKANDLIHWQTHLITSDVDGLSKSLRDAHTPWVSSGVTQFTDARIGFGRGVLVRDPDGHAMEITDR